MTGEAAGTRRSRVTLTLSERQAHAVVLALRTTAPTVRGRTRGLVLAAQVRVANALRKGEKPCATS